MDNKKKNLSEHDPQSVPSATDMRFAIIVSEWNEEITFAMRDAAVNTLIEHGAIMDDIAIKYVPGSFELPAAAKFIADNLDIDAIICIGCVIQGETRHFEFINIAVANGITNVSLDTNIPVIYGVLTPDNWEQAKDRAGGKHGNKGVEAAISAIKMADLREDMYFFDDLMSKMPFDDDYDDEMEEDYPFDYDDDDDDFDDDFDDDDDNDNPNHPSKLN